MCQVALLETMPIKSCTLFKHDRPRGATMSRIEAMEEDMAIKEDDLSGVTVEDLQ